MTTSICWPCASSQFFYFYLHHNLFIKLRNVWFTGYSWWCVSCHNELWWRKKNSKSQTVGWMCLVWRAAHVKQSVLLFSSVGNVAALVFVCWDFLLLKFEIQSVSSLQTKTHNIMCPQSLYECSGRPTWKPACRACHHYSDVFVLHVTWLWSLKKPTISEKTATQNLHGTQVSACRK